MSGLARQSSQRSMYLPVYAITSERCISEGTGASYTTYLSYDDTRFYVYIYLISHSPFLHSSLYLKKRP